jgi:hypothetical protein
MVFNNPVPCVMIAPFGRPVVPDVYIIVIGVSWVQSAGPVRSAASANGCSSSPSTSQLMTIWNQPVGVELDASLGEPGVDDEEHGCGVTMDEFEFSNGQPPIERAENRADLPAGELRVEEIGVVPGEQGDSVAEANTVHVTQTGRQSAATVVHLGVRESTVGAQVDRRQLVRTSPGVVSNPVK